MAAGTGSQRVAAVETMGPATGRWLRHPRPQAERVALRKGMIDLRLAEPREGYGRATMRILDDRSLIALKPSADYHIARLGSVRFPAAQRPA